MITTDDLLELIEAEKLFELLVDTVKKKPEDKRTDWDKRVLWLIEEGPLEYYDLHDWHYCGDYISIQGNCNGAAVNINYTGNINEFDELDCEEMEKLELCKFDEANSNVVWRKL